MENRKRYWSTPYATTRAPTPAAPGPDRIPSRGGSAMRLMPAARVRRGPGGSPRLLPHQSQALEREGLVDHVHGLALGRDEAREPAGGDHVRRAPDLDREAAHQGVHLAG